MTAKCCMEDKFNLQFTSKASHNKIFEALQIFFEWKIVPYYKQVILWNNGCLDKRRKFVKLSRFS